MDFLEGAVELFSSGLVLGGERTWGGWERCIYAHVVLEDVAGGTAGEVVG